jgi:hypothetical protein
MLLLNGINSKIIANIGRWKHMICYKFILWIANYWSRIELPVKV